MCCNLLERGLAEAFELGAVAAKIKQLAALKQATFLVISTEILSMHYSNNDIIEAFKALCIGTGTSYQCLILLRLLYGI